MFDSDIRPILKQCISQAHADVAIFDELPLCRQGRADVAAVNACLSGFEIKSERDTLTRLPLQVGLYDCIFDYSTVVTAEKHLRYVRAIIPSRWGIQIARHSEGCISIEHVRKALKNSAVSTESLIRLLWKTEATRILRDRSIPVSPNVLVREVWNLMSQIPERDLKCAVRDALKARRGSAVDSPQTSCDD